MATRRTNRYTSSALSDLGKEYCYLKFMRGKNALAKKEREYSVGLYIQSIDFWGVYVNSYYIKHIGHAKNQGVSF